MGLATTILDEMATQVLIVDDCAANRNLVRLYLQSARQNYNLEYAGQLSEGLEMLRNRHTDIVLVNLDLPDSQGKETVRKLIFGAPSVPILALTDSLDSNIALEAVRSGAQDCIVKGQINNNTLTRAIDHAIERNQALIILRESRQNQLEFKTKFLSHVSHELRSPLASIHQYAEVMLDGLAGPLTDKEREYLKNVLRNAGQLNNLITDLLDAASANVGKLTIEPARVMILPFIERSMRILGARAKSRGIILTAKIESDIPPVLADGRRLLQIIINLLENALKFTDSGGAIALCASVSASDPRFVQFSVADTGRGIDPENLNRIFDRSYQEQNAVSNRRGLGLGLAICEELVKQHGGRIWVESKPGKGSVFSFIVPLFSLPATISPLLVDGGKIREASLVAIEILPGNRTVTDEIWELIQQRSRAIVERCMLPDSDLLLPSMRAFDRRETIFILACTDPAGASVLERRILAQLTARPQMVNTSIYRSLCIALPSVPVEIAPLDKQLEWFSEKIEKVVLEATDIWEKLHATSHSLNRG